MLVHASCVAIDGHAILLRGPSGSGKSDLALRLIDEGAALVADDQVLLEAVMLETGGGLMASAPAALFGLLEVRGIGIVRCDAIGSAPVRLVIDLDAAAAIERMPGNGTCALRGIEFPRLTLNPFESSAPAKLRIALRACLLQR